MNLKIQTILISIVSIWLVSALTACSPSSDDASGKPAAQPGTQAIDTAAEAGANDFPYSFEKVADNTWVMHGPRELPNPQNKGFMNNPGIVKTSAGLVMIDPGSTVHIGHNVLAEVKKISELPIVAVFNTHIHGDHWLANQAVKDVYPNVKIYGHTEMLAEIDNGEGDNWVSLMDSMTEGGQQRDRRCRA